MNMQDTNFQKVLSFDDGTSHQCDRTLTASDGVEGPGRRGSGLSMILVYYQSKGMRGNNGATGMHMHAWHSTRRVKTANDNTKLRIWFGFHTRQNESPTTHYPN